MSPDFRQADSGLSSEKRAIEFPLLAGRQLCAWPSLPLSLGLICLQGGHSEGVEGKATTCHFRPRDLARIPAWPAAAFRGSSKWMAHHALARLLFILSGILLQRDNNCLSQGHRLDGQWLALDQQIQFFTIYQLSKSCF